MWSLANFRTSSVTIMRRFFDDEPNSWRDLEEKVHQAFAEMGYESQRGKKITTVRGSVEVDVYAVKPTSPIPTKVIVECKYWDKLVPQSVVHGFRTVCADAGAHFGLIISRRGFQPGAERSRDSTNVHLMDFSEFQETFFGEWKSGVFMMLSRMRDQILPILRASSGTVEYGLDLISENDIAGVEPMEKYSILFGLEGGYSQFFVQRDEFPATFNDPRGDPREIDRLTVSSHREYLEVAKAAVAECNERFGLPEKYFSSDGRLLVPAARE